MRLQARDRNGLAGGIERRGRVERHVPLARVVKLRRELELQRLLRTARVEPEVARDAVARDTFGHELQLSDRVIRRILDATRHRDMVHPRSWHAGVAAVESDRGLRMPRRLRQLDVGRERTVHRLAEPRSQVIELSDARRDSALWERVAGAQRQCSLGMDALPVRVLDRAVQRAIPAALDRQRELQRRAVERRARVDLARRRPGQAAQAHRGLDRAARESVGGDLARRIGGELQVGAAPKRASLSFHATGSVGGEHSQVRQRDLPLEVELVACARALSRRAQRLAVDLRPLDGDLVSLKRRRDGDLRCVAEERGHRRRAADHGERADDCHVGHVVVHRHHRVERRLTLEIQPRDRGERRERRRTHLGLAAHLAAGVRASIERKQRMREAEGHRSCRIVEPDVRDEIDRRRFE